MLPPDDFSESSDSTVHLIVRGISDSLYWFKRDQKFFTRFLILVALLQLLVLIHILIVLVCIWESIRSTSWGTPSPPVTP